MYDCKQIVLDYFVKNVWAMGNERRVHQKCKVDAMSVIISNLKRTELNNIYCLICFQIADGDQYLTNIYIMLIYHPLCTFDDRADISLPT